MCTCGGALLAPRRDHVRREDRLRQLVDRLRSPVKTWAMWRQGARAVVSDPCRGHRLRDRPGWRKGQDNVLRLDNLDAGRPDAVLRLQLVRDSRHQLIDATSATTSSSVVVEPRPTWSPGP